MTIKTEDLLNSILGSLDRIAYIKADDIPNIDLYMDQVTTFMESRLKSSFESKNCSVIGFSSSCISLIDKIPL